MQGRKGISAQVQVLYSNTMMVAALMTAAAAAALAPGSPRYFASCVKGIEPILATELASSAIGATSVEEGHLGVHFTGPPDVGMRAVLWTRTALRVMELLASSEGIFTAENLYEMARDSVEWTELLAGPDQTISVQAVLGTQRAAERGRMRAGDWQCGACGSIVFASKTECFSCGASKPHSDEGGGSLTHSHFSALTVKNAVCDELRDRLGWRPSVDAEDADLPLFLYVHKGDASLYRLLSGGSSMHKRGYRTGAVHVAALRETLAAAMVLQAEYDPSVDILCDPMSGSGTIPIEAALIATNTAPGLLRAPPPLTRWPDSDPSLWAAASAEADAARLARAPLPIFGNDYHDGACALAERAAHAAGLASSLTLTQSDVCDYTPSAQPTLVVTNPPWDRRLEGGEEAWTALGGFLRRECRGANAWVLSGNKELTRHLRMKASSRRAIESAGSSLALIAYEVLKPKPEGAPRSDDDVLAASPAAAAAPAAEATPVAAGVEAPKNVADDGIDDASYSEPGQRSPAAAVGIRPAIDLPTESTARGTAAHHVATTATVDEVPDEQAISAMTVAQLKVALRARGLPVSGLKAALVTRLMEANDGMGTRAKVSTQPGSIKPGVFLADGSNKGADELAEVFSSLYK